MQQHTPVRDTGRTTEDGWVLLRDVGSDYRDGAEEALFDVVSAADPADLASTSDTLLGRVTTWAERYHLHPARANIVRPLDLAATHRVLEVGAGCGAVTRYLGERAGLVDALEPVPARARVARARTRDLPGVEVFVGEIDDVPPAAAYDVIVVVGVLEYVGGGSPADEPYLSFLQKVADRLVPGGSLVLAIENKLGVKYLAGAPEDHTDRTFDSLESYPYGGPARTFARTELEDLARTAGLDPVVRLAFPDYKITRTVLDPHLLAGPHRSLLHRIPTFPSPDWGSPRPRLADEWRLWRSLVTAGLAADSGNSFLLTAAKGPGPAVWPAGSAGAFYSTSRRTGFSTETRLVSEGGVLRFDRTALSGPPADGDLAMRATTEPYIDGVDFFDAAAEADHVVALPDLMRQWLLALDEAVADGGAVPLDLVPHNLVRQADGRLLPFDQEWTSATATREDVVRRGVLWLAIGLAARTPPAAWPGCDTVGDIARRLGPMAGLDDEGHWITPAVAWEARFQASVQQVPAGETEDGSLHRHSQNMLATLGTRLVRGPLGEREPELRQRAEATVVHLEDVLAATRGSEARLQDEVRMTAVHVRSLEEEIDRLRGHTAALEGHPVVRLAHLASRAAAVVAPQGSVQRRVYGLAKRGVSRALESARSRPAG